MRKVDLRPYKVPLQNPQTGETVERDYDCGRSVRILLMNPQLQLNGAELLAHSDLSDKIAETTDEVILEEAEYEMLLGALDKIRGFTQNDVDLVRRIKNAPEVRAKGGDFEVVK